MQPELYKLMTELNETNYNDAKCEAWVASAYYSLSTDRPKRAELFAAKVIPNIPIAQDLKRETAYDSLSVLIGICFSRRQES